jgi:ring-1,2-phenylacetyl-CoA epoxidase subunit PaaC
LTYTDEKIKNAVFEYLLRMGDDRLVLGHRLAELCGHGPILEEDLATTNTSLDLLGSAVQLLKYAGEVEGKGRDEDKLAYFRNDLQFRNSLLVEIPDEDFAYTTVKQFFFDVFEYYHLTELKTSKDEQISAIAQKTLKETAYHLRHSSEWMKRLGDGTEESHQRMADALDELWSYTGDMFYTDEVDEILLAEGIGADMTKVKEQWLGSVRQIIEEATLEMPAPDAFMNIGGRIGKHTEFLGFILNDMQYLTRSMPDAKW